jgi:hypothetical protein
MAAAKTALASWRTLAIMPPSQSPNEASEIVSGPTHSSTSPATREEPEVILDALPYMAWWIRGTLVGIVAGLVLVFYTAATLNPYYSDGTARTMETHTLLGLPPCTFKTLTGFPCPSCGMTTSFALLVRGDVWHSMRANFVGTLLAMFCLLLIPWSLVSVWLGRPLFMTSIEDVFARIVIGFLALLLTRWVIVLVWFWATQGR